MRKSYENKNRIIGYLKINSLGNKILNKSNKTTFMIANHQFARLRRDKVKKKTGMEKCLQEERKNCFLEDKNTSKENQQKLIVLSS